MDYDFFTRYLDAWNRHSVDDVLSFLTPDCTYADVALNQSHTGTAAIRDFVASVERELSSNYRFEPGPVVVSQAGYAVEWVMNGTNDRAGPQLPATGKPFAIRGVSVGQLRDGKIVRNTDYWSLAELLMQVGLMPAPPSSAH